jgi:hypothetical protein
LQSAREAARRRDAEARAKDHDPDRIVSLFRLGFEVDELLDERLQHWKASGTEPLAALPALREVISDRWQPERFLDWVHAHGDSETVTAPVGRRLKGEPPESLTLRLRKLVAALAPLGGEYPLPHFRRGA